MNELKYQITITIMLACMFGMTCIAASRSTDDEVYIAEMQKTIMTDEEVLDSIATIMPFGDTVAEGDNYQTLIEAKKGFENATELETMELCYAQYKKFFFKVHEECIKYLENRAKRDTISKLPIVVCHD